MSCFRSVLHHRVLLATACTALATVDVQASTSADCLGCHAGEFESLSRHFLESNDDCLICHRIFGEAPDHPWLDTAGASVCTDCHLQAGLDMASTEHRALACTACHDPPAIPPASWVGPTRAVREPAT